MRLTVTPNFSIMVNHTKICKLVLKTDGSSGRGIMLMNLKKHITGSDIDFAISTKLHIVLVVRSISLAA